LKQGIINDWTYQYGSLANTGCRDNMLMGLIIQIQ